MRQKDTYLEAVELPSPTNTIVNRYIAAVQLFANAIYKEYKTVVITIIIIILCVLGWILWDTRNKWRVYLMFWGEFLSQLFTTAVKLYKQIKKDILKKG